jgi:CrcB protein
MMNFLLIFLGGGLGSITRFGISLLVAKTALHSGVSTLISNVVACLLLVGVIFVFHQKNVVPDMYKSFVLIGICGGLSTFSTFSYETFELFKQGMIAWAVANIVISCGLCLSIFYAFSK